MVTTRELRPLATMLELQDKAAPAHLGGIRNQCDATIEACNGLCHDCQSHAAGLQLVARFDRLEHLEHALVQLGGNARAIIRDFQLPATRPGLPSHVDPGGLGVMMLGRIADQIHDRDLEEVDIRENFEITAVQMHLVTVRQVQQLDRMHDGFADADARPRNRLPAHP